VRDFAEAKSAFKKLGWPKRKLFVEAFAQFERELAVLVVRAIDGQLVQYPVVETRQDVNLHICREVLAPADLPALRADLLGAVCEHPG